MTYDTFGQGPFGPTPLGATPYQPPQDPTVTTDIPCRKCSYNLRTLSVYGRCPECGTPVGLSVQGDLLRFSDPAWVGTLASGMTLILCGIAASVISLIFSVAAQLGHQPALISFSGLLLLASSGLAMIGSWFLTTPDPSGLGEDKYGTARKLIRVALAVGFCNSILNQAIQFRLVHANVSLLMMIIFVGSVIGLVGTIAQLFYIKQLALRVPDMDISNRAGFLMFALGISIGIMYLISLVMQMAVLSRAVNATIAMLQTLGCVVGILALVMLVFWIMYLILLIKLGGALRTQAAIAQQTWARTPFGGMPGGGAPPAGPGMAV